MARVISLKTPKKHRRIERTLQAKSARVLHADRRAHQLVFPRARRGFCVDFHDIYDDRRKIPGTVHHRVLLLLFDCDRIFGVSHISRRLGYEEKARVAQNRLPCSQSQRHCLRNVHVPFISPNIRLRRARSVDCHRNRRLCALPLEIQRLPQRVRHLVFRHRRAYACGILHGVLLSDRHIRAHLFRVSCRACVLPSRRGSVRRTQKIRALRLPLLRACRTGAVFGGNLSSNHRQINTSSLVNK